MRFAQFTPLNPLFPNLHDQTIYVNLDRILWVRPFIYERFRRDDKGSFLMTGTKEDRYEFIPAVALGYGSSDSGEIIIVNLLSKVLACLDGVSGAAE